MPVHYPTALVQLFITLEELGKKEAGEPIQIDTLPLRLEWVENRYNEANTFKVTLSLEDFPLDPRILRGASFKAYLADAGSLDPLFWEKQTDLTQFIVFAGVVDEIETDIDDEWRKTTLKGRDYTAYFLDVSASSLPVTYEKDGRDMLFVEVINSVIKQVPNAAAITIEPDPDLGDIHPAEYRDKGKLKTLGARKKKDGESPWDVMSEIALHAGVVIYMDLDRIRIRKPSSIFLSAESIIAGNSWDFVLGQNLKRLKTHRNMGRQHGISVQVTSYCPGAPNGKKTLTARKIDPDRITLNAAKKADDPQAGATKGDGKGNPPPPIFTPYVVCGICDQVQLQKIADQIWTLLRHHELEGVIETDDMVDSGGKVLTLMRYGDPIEVGISENFQSILSLDRGPQKERLLAIGYDQQSAEDISVSLNSIRVPYYVDKVTHRFSTDDDEGYSISIGVRSRKQVDLTKEA